MRSSRVRRVKRTSRKSISRALSRMPRSKRGKRSNKGGRTKKGSKRNILEELRETLSLPELESDLGILSVQKKKKSKKKKKKSKAWSAKLHGKGTKGKKGKKKHKKKKMKGGSVRVLEERRLAKEIESSLNKLADLDPQNFLKFKGVRFEELPMNEKETLFNILNGNNGGLTSYLNLGASKKLRYERFNEILTKYTIFREGRTPPMPKKWETLSSE